MDSTIFFIPQSKLEQEVSVMRSELRLMKAEIDYLASRIAAFPEPPRAGWTRYPLEPKISRVTLQPTTQFVTTYDHAGRVIMHLSGAFQEVGLRVLALTGDSLDWEMVDDVSVSRIVQLPTTPLPEVI